MRLLIALGIGLILMGTADADTFVYLSLAKDRKIAVYQCNTDDGRLTLYADAACEGEPAALIANPAGTALFASLRPEGKLSSFRIEPDGKLTPLNTIEAGSDPAHLSTDSEGRFLLSAYYVAAKASIHAIERDGSLRKEPLESRKTAEKAHAIVLDPANEFAFIPHTGPNAIFQFAFDRKTGTLTPGAPAQLSTPAGTGPRHLVFHPRLKVAYVANEQGGSVTAYQFDSKTGSLKPQQTLSTLPGDFRGTNSCAEIKLHPTGKLLYVSNRGHDSLARFRIDDRSGELTALGQTLTEATPRSFDLDSTGRYLYAAGESTGKVAAFRVDGQNGALTRTGTYPVGNTPWWVMTLTLKR